MTASMRFTAFDFDASKYDAMLSDVNDLDSDRLTAISGFVAVSYTHQTLPTNREV